MRAIASRASGDTGPAETVDTPVTVTVTDEDEKGEVVISWLQPEAGTAIMASLTDPDGSSGAILPVDDAGTVIDNPTLTWEVSKIAANVLKIDNDDHWGAAPGATQNGYTPTDDDEGKYLRVTALNYTDRNGSDKTARMMSAYPVQAADGGKENGSPDFVDEKVDVGVAETAAVGDKVGAPITAPTGGGPAKDRLTYGLRAFIAGDIGSTGLTVPTTAVADAAAFNIDKASGQITLAAKLDFESRSDGEYVVVATVTDPSNLFDSIVVVITAEDINEDPVLSGRPELTILEIDSGAEDAADPDFVGNTDPASVNVYNVVDEDSRAGTQSWSLEGEDAGEFQLIGTVGRTLSFRTQPDYENPADFNGDNVYKVTVVTLDGHGGRGEFDVCIAVMNINEEGKITLLDEDGKELVQPHALGPITADLTDPDGGVTDVVWVWSRAKVDPPGTGGDLDRSPIDGATSATYTPTNDDTSYYLHVLATYMDATNDADDTDDRMADATAAHAVLEVKDEQRPPEFSEETAMRMVAENAPSTTFVGEPLSLAMDLDDPTGMGLKYTLEDSEDTAFFELLSTNVGPDNDAYTDDDTYSTQIRVKLHDMAHDLDHEAEGRNGAYEVVLKVTDGSELVDTITVTITVTDRNEAPSTPMEASDDAPTPDANNAPAFPSTETGAREVAENTAAGENIGAPVMATDADPGDTLAYTLGGTDMASFAIDDTTGQLMTDAALDFEMPADADMDNDYEVTVTASDGTDEAMVAVTITVTDAPEGSELSPYDTDNSGKIEGPEVIQAVKDYFAGTITGAEVIEVVKLYFAGRSG